MTIEITKQLADAGQWHQLIGVQVRSLRLDACPILNRLCDTRWKVSLDCLATPTAQLDFGLVLGDFNAKVGKKIEGEIETFDLDLELPIKLNAADLGKRTRAWCTPLGVLFRTS